MTEILSYLQNVDAIAFVLLGIATAVGWARRRDRSLGYLALAIVLLSLVSLLGRIPALLHVTPPLLRQISLLAFIGSGYMLLRYRASIIPLSHRWHAAAVVLMVAASGSFIAAQALAAGRTVLTVATIAIIFIWSAAIGEPIVRFWLAARQLPAVQAWRLRSLSLGFGGIVAIILFAVSGGALVRDPLIQVVIELLVLAIVPLLFVSFSPPAWLRRQWRASEEQGLHRFMEEFLLSEDRDTLTKRALDWAMRLVGGESALTLDSAGKPSASRGMNTHEIDQLQAQLPHLHQGVNRITVSGSDRTILMLPVAGLAGSGTLVVLAGPFTPGFGVDEMSRVQQFMSGFTTALDRIDLIVQLKASNARLEEANRHKSVFLANMSHELRTPLNAIIGFSELMTDAREGQFDEATRKRFLDQVLRSGRHLLGLINDILDLSKVEAGQMELRLQMVSVAEAADQVTKTVEPLLAKKNIHLQSNVAEAGLVLADTGKLKQMLLNLVSNAIKFTPEGGTVSIRANRTEDAVEISIADTGIGIAESDQKQIFQEFHQVDAGPGRQHEGTGLGLALTKRFALLHGGDVRVQSRINQGSVFTLRLPVHPTAPEQLSQAQAALAMNSHDADPMVLVVEDDIAAAELLTRQLASAGYRTYVARTGTEALSKARELQPAAITLDIILPELDGWEVITQLKSDEATSAIPIVVVSVVDNPELGMALGAIDYFVKPVDSKELVRRLSRFDFKRSLGQDEVCVLVVDDEPANRIWLTNALEPAGFTVLAAAGGHEAIELARAHKPDLVLLDLMMPEVSGFDVIEALRSDAATQETPIMVLTATNLTEADKHHLNGRVSDILSRGSVRGSDLISQLRRVVADRNGIT